MKQKFCVRIMIYKSVSVLFFYFCFVNVNHTYKHMHIHTTRANTQTHVQINITSDVLRTSSVFSINLESIKRNSHIFWMDACMDGKKGARTW